MDPAAPEDEPSRLRKRRRWPLWTGLCVIVLGLLTWVWFMDADPPDDSAMMPHYKPDVPGGNPLELFTNELEAHPLSEFATLLNAAGGDYKKIPTDDMQAYLKANATQIEAFDRLMQTQPITWQWPKIQDHSAVANSIHYLSSCHMMVTGVQRMRIELSIREGMRKEAAAEILKAIKYGNGMAEATSPVVQWLVASACQRVGHEQLPNVLTGSDFTADDLRAVQQELACSEIKARSLGEALRLEYIFQRETIKELHHMTVTPLLVDNKMLFLIKHFYRPNNTLHLMLKFEMPPVEGASRGWSDMVHASDHSTRALGAWRSNWLSFYISPNFGGHAVVYDSISNLSGFCPNAPNVVAQHRQAVIMIALRRYELAEGKLPTNLGALVPKYLPSVPPDPFDDAPMRWDLGRQVLYSIGKDMTDDSGTFGIPWKSADKDIGMYYWWGPHGAKATTPPAAPVPVRRTPAPTPVPKPKRLSP